MDSPQCNMRRSRSYIPDYERQNVNPFVNMTNVMPPSQIAKMIILGPFLVIPRLALAGITLFIMYIFSIIVTVGHHDGLPLEKWRLFFQQPIFWCLRVQLFLFGFIWIKVKGCPSPKNAAPIMVSNHVSPFEPIFLVYRTKAAPLQRSEDSKVPIVGRIQRALQVLFVDRTDGNSRRNTVKAIKERSMKGNLFPQVLVFPEGTCNNQQAIITFKNGAFHPGECVQPVLIRYRYRHVDPSFPAVSPSLLVLAIRMLCQVYNTMEVEFLDVYKPNAEEAVNPSLYASNVRQYMSHRLGVPATQHAYEDAALQFAARSMKAKMEGAVVEWAAVRLVLEINTDTAKQYLKVFTELDKDKDGRLSYIEFAAGWHKKHSQDVNNAMATRLNGQKRYLSTSTVETGVMENELQKVFDLLDTDGYGSLDFRQFLTGLSILNGMGKAGRRDAYKFALDVLDAEDKGSFTIKELEHILWRLFPSMPAQAMDEALREADINGNGIISRNDFLAFAEKHDQILTTYSSWIRSDIMGQSLHLHAPILWKGENSNAYRECENSPLYEYEASSDTPLGGNLSDKVLV